MSDPTDKGAEAAADVPSSDDGHSGENKKTCADCGTSKTPLWRGGPAGPKSLCNACGIRSRKKRRVIVGLSKGSEDMKKSKKGSMGGLNPNNNSKAKFGDPWKRRLLGLGRKVSFQRPPSPSSSSSEADQRQRRRKLGEVEQAAVLLMALSYGSVYA
ncbi:GATA transcription factor 16-like [Punica granatum]|uniref:GATA-type domain-containing protein n=2 Tax=Punica granatum TaxID=22663 RepID=A0A218WF88_PUNGR|nr:GATA transcription factor 16-like [Punica granatum]OWM71148.1 hypothetical protein CDL15_Pgr011275 [Punica granatum]PKI40674.1 hypothetical protein CRG98_038929 [Punica granatum]